MMKHLHVIGRAILVLQCLALVSGSVYLMLTGDTVSDALLVVACLAASSLGLTKACEG